jgi:hypothetical protein
MPAGFSIITLEQDGFGWDHLGSTRGASTAGYGLSAICAGNGPTLRRFRHL